MLAGFLTGVNAEAAPPHSRAGFDQGVRVKRLPPMAGEGLDRRAHAERHGHPARHEP